MLIPEELKHNKFRDVRVISPKDLILSGTCPAQVPSDSMYSGDDVEVHNPARKIDIDFDVVEKNDYDE